MFIDFSVLRNIDFTNKDNLVFLAIIFVLVSIIILLFLFVVITIIKAIKKWIGKLFHKDAKKQNFVQKSGVDSGRYQAQNNSTAAALPTHQLAESPNTTAVRATPTAAGLKRCLPRTATDRKSVV